MAHQTHEFPRETSSTVDGGFFEGVEEVFTIASLDAICLDDGLGIRCIPSNIFCLHLGESSLLHIVLHKAKQQPLWQRITARSIMMLTLDHMDVGQNGRPRGPQMLV